MDLREIRTIRTYCAQCFSNCPVVAQVEAGRFVKVMPDKAHHFYRPLCPKGHAGPELVSDPQRLEYPVKRTLPKNSADPGWERISWEEALTTVADRMRRIKAEHGAEAFAFSQTNVSSPMWEITAFIRRLANRYGSPNHLTTTHICNWHRDNGSALTYGQPGDSFSAGWADFERSNCILIWGHNPKATHNVFYRQIQTARKNGAKIVVVDPRRTEIAAQADLWLQVKPGTDGALALGMIHVMLAEKRYDDAFVQHWTNAAFLVRTDTMDLLRTADLGTVDGENEAFYVVDRESQGLVPCAAKQKMTCRADVAAEVVVTFGDGRSVTCRTVLAMLRTSVDAYSPVAVERHTGIAAEKIVNAVRMATDNGPASWFSFNGIEQNMNATQTNRAICVFYALTGDYDKRGGNRINSPVPPLDYPFGFEYVTPAMFAKNIALKAHPLGPAGTLMSVPAYLLCKAITKADPYKVRGLMLFGANPVSANPNSKMMAEALQELSFQVNIDHFINPTAKYADIVLPSASVWETGRIGYPLGYQDNKWVVQWRAPVAEPRGESKDELWIIFELAKRLGYKEDFWGGDIEAAFQKMLQPLDVDLQELKHADGGIFIQGPEQQQKYRQDGFNSLTGRVELFSQPLKDVGHSPLPEWKDPQVCFQAVGIDKDRYPFLLINAKVREFCQSQHRSMPALRKKHPQPSVEINTVMAHERGIAPGDMVVLETAYGQIYLEAVLTDKLAFDVVCTQHGWWQGCPDLNLPAYDPVASEGAVNVNLLYRNHFTDPISGSVHMRGFPCNIRKIDRL